MGMFKCKKRDFTKLVEYTKQRNPTDRARSGTKISLLVEGKGMPLALKVAGANKQDMRSDSG